MARQRKKGNPIVTAVIFGIFGIVLLFLGIRTFIGLHGTLLNVTTCDPSEIKPGIYVEGTISYGYGAYIEKTTTYNHIVTKTDGYYYLVDICDKNADGSDNDTARWIGISISILLFNTSVQSRRPSIFNQKSRLFDPNQKSKAFDISQKSLVQQTCCPSRRVHWPGSVHSHPHWSPHPHGRHSEPGIHGT